MRVRCCSKFATTDSLADQRSRSRRRRSRGAARGHSALPADRYENGAGDVAGRDSNFTAENSLSQQWLDPELPGSKGNDRRGFALGKLPQARTDDAGSRGRGRRTSGGARSAPTVAARAGTNRRHHLRCKDGGELACPKAPRVFLFSVLSDGSRRTGRFTDTSQFL